MYWLSSGLVSLREGRSTHQKKGLWLVDGLLEIIVGAVLLLRPMYKYLLDPDLAVKIFGVIAVLVGLSRIFAGSRYTNTGMVYQRSWSPFFLSVFEVGLGLLLIFFGALEPFTKLLAGGWSFLGGTMLILQSFQRQEVQSTRF